MIIKSAVSSLIFMFVFGMWGTVSAKVSIQPGDLIKTQSNPVIFYIDDTQRNLPFSDEGFAVRYGNDFSRIKIVSDSDIKPYTGHNFLNRALSVPEGSLIMYYPDPTVYLIENGMKRGFVSWDAFVTRGYQSQNIQCAGAYHIYATGANLN